MPGLSFGSNQTQRRRPGLWWIPVVLIIVAIALITLCIRFDNGGPFAAVRNAVHTVTSPIQSALSQIPSPIKGIESMGRDETIAQLEQENQQLRTLVAELEEYRQQGQRLTTLTGLSDMYGLESVSAEVVGTTSGWSRTATINKGSADGIQVGMGVMSSCGLYGQVESVASSTSVIRLVNDATSSVSAMVQSSRARGILRGSYDGTLVLEYVSVEKTVGEGDIVISSGQGGTYPRGLVIGTARSIEVDSSKLYYRITVEPIYGIDSCEEVMVLTGQESSTQNVLNKAAIEEIMSASTRVENIAESDASAGQSEEASANASQNASSASDESSSSENSSAGSANADTDNNGNETENLIAGSSSGDADE